MNNKNKIYTIENSGFENFSYTLCEDKNVLYPVFVYGTLKQGFFNYTRCGLNNEIFLGTCYSRDEMFDFWSMQGVYPAVVNSNRKSYRVGGELYLIDEQKICFLDMMENNYNRISIPITMHSDHYKKYLKTPLKSAFLYMLSPKNKNSNYWTQDDNQIKIIDKNKNLKIWGGKWAKEDLYKSGRKFRNKKQYVFHGGIWNETTKEKNEDPKN